MNTRIAVAAVVCALSVGNCAQTLRAATEISGQTLTNATVAGEATVYTNAAVDVVGNLTLDAATITFNSDNPWLRFQIGAAQQSILGDGMLLLERGRPVLISFGHLTVGEEVVIDVMGSTDRVRFQGNSLTNHGTLLVGSGADTSLPVPDFINYGSIVNEGRLAISGEDNYSWRNEGTLTLRAGSTTFFHGTFTLDDLGTVIDEGGDVELIGIIDLVDQTLDLEALPFEDNLRMYGGEYRNGRIISSGDATIDFIRNQFAGRFNNITLATDLVVADRGSGTTLRVSNGLTLEDVTVTLPEGAEIVFDEGEQFLTGSGTILAINDSSASAITKIWGSSLIIGEDVTIRNGTEAYRELNLRFKENHGLIVAEAPGALVVVGEYIPSDQGQRWFNRGTIRVEEGTVEFRGNYSSDNLGDLQNLGGRVVFDGHYFNTDRILSLPSGGGEWLIDGTVIGGRVEAAEGLVVPVGGFLDGVTLQGQFETRAGSRGGAGFVVKNQLTLDDATVLVKRGHSLITEGIPYLRVEGDGVIQLDGATNETIVYSPALLIGPGVTVETTITGGGRVDAATVLNQGTITSQAVGLAPLRIDGNITNAGILAAKQSGIFVRGSVDFTADSLLVVDLSPNLSTYLNSTGLIDLEGMLAVRGFDGMAVGDQFTLLNSNLNNGVRGRFANVGDEVLSGHVAFRIDYTPQFVTITVTRVPEPTTVAGLLVALCSGHLLLVRRRRR
jgi:hypothetical protein